MKYMFWIVHWPFNFSGMSYMSIFWYLQGRNWQLWNCLRLLTQSTVVSWRPLCKKNYYIVYKSLSCSNHLGLALQLRHVFWDQVDEQFKSGSPKIAPEKQRTWGMMRPNCKRCQITIRHRLSGGSNLCEP